MNRRLETSREILRGFTLIEMLVVMGTMAVLAGMTVGSVGAARDAARRAECASNLGMMAKAALAYADDHRGQFPWASRRVNGETVCWDFVTAKDGSVRPGEMWNGYGIASVIQCPAYAGGKANWKNNPYTGYNYNCSYIGKVQGDPGKRQSPARIAEIRDPARTALFGDGQYGSGANKFMRAPVREVAFDGSGKSIRLAGTQGFRHRGKTNVAFCDGHVEPLAQPYQYGGAEGFTEQDCGFLSPDNGLYSLDK
jgi:general secretion pathway protein G